MSNELKLFRNTLLTKVKPRLSLVADRSVICQTDLFHS
jgi:hypothetical protein